jgi:hypothetical protein
MTSLTWLLLDFRSFIHENHLSLEFPNWGSLKLLNFAGSRSPELRQFPDSRTSQVSSLLNFTSFQTPELRRFHVSWTSLVSRLPNFAGSRSPELHQFPDSRTSQVPGLLNFASFQTPELRRFQVSWISLVSNHPETDSRFANWSQFGYYFRISLEGQRNVWNSSGSLHECFLFTKQNFPSRC